MFSGTQQKTDFKLLFTHESGYFHYLLFGKFALETSFGLVSFSALLQVCGNSIELNGVELKIGYLSYSITNNYTRIKFIEHDANFFSIRIGDCVLHKTVPTFNDNNLYIELHKYIPVTQCCYFVYLIIL